MMLKLSPRRIAGFWRRVHMGAPQECWQWRGSDTTRRGYGRIIINGHRVMAHRVAYVLHNGAFPAHLYICHSCDNPSCCNPAHLWIGTHKDNMADMRSKNRHAHGYRHGRYTQPDRTARGDRNGSRVHPGRLKRGAASPSARLSEADVLNIVHLLAQRPRTWSHRRGARKAISYVSIAGNYGVSPSTIQAINAGLTWKHLSMENK